MKQHAAAFTLAIVMASAALAAEGKLEGKFERNLEPLLGEPTIDIQQAFKDQRLPNVVVATDGAVLAAWGWGQVRVRRSEDGGTTWGPEIAVGKGLLSGGVTVDEKTGDILLFTEAKQSGLDRREPRLAEIAVFNRLTTVWAMYEAAQRTTSISL